MCNVLKGKATLRGLDKQKRLTSRAYDRWSLVWEVAGCTNRAIYDAALGLLDERHKKVVDVGCGTGLMSRKLAASGRQVLGVDISPAMIERARRKGGVGIEFAHGDAERLPAKDGGFDAVINLISFHQV
jgi:ubiquinone/menaquinone biosynthesis C-methylase UbiE